MKQRKWFITHRQPGPKKITRAISQPKTNIRHQPTYERFRSHSCTTVDLDSDCCLSQNPPSSNYSGNNILKPVRVHKQACWLLFKNKENEWWFQIRNRDKKPRTPCMWGEHDNTQVKQYLMYSPQSTRHSLIVALRDILMVLRFVLNKAGW